MKRTISVEVGKGSVNHNSRKFKAANVDGERSCRNIDYCNEPIQKVFHELFDNALYAYNAKQSRTDRRIENYYVKIRTGKQEKPFHEVILQIGNKDDKGTKQGLCFSPEGVRQSADRRSFGKSARTAEITAQSARKIL